MKRLNGFSRFMSEVMGRGGILRTPNPESRTPIHMVVILALLMLITTLWFTPQAHAQVMPGDTLVIDISAGTNFKGALFRVNPDGSRTILSDFSNMDQGPLGEDPVGVALDASGSILVIDPTAGTNSHGALFRVNPATGNRTLLSDFGNSAQGTLGALEGNPFGVALDASGSILVTDVSFGTDGRGALFRVNPTSGFRTLLSDFGTGAQDTLGDEPFGVAVDSSGNILVIDYQAGTDKKGVLFRVDPTNGNRIVVSDFGTGAQDTLGKEPSGVAVDASGNILVIDLSAGTGAKGALFRVDPANGNRTVVSDFGNNAQGALGEDPVGVALDASGSILVIDQSGATAGSRGMLFRVDPTNGNRTVVSDFGDGPGPLGVDPRGVATIPPQPRLGDMLVIDQDAGVNGSGALFSLDLFNGSRSLITNFGMSTQGPVGMNPFGVAVDASGNILILDQSGGTSFKGALFRINPANGTRTLLSNFGNIAQGPGEAPIGVALEASGNILVTDRNAGTAGRGALFRVNPTSGKRTVLSDFGNGNQGPQGEEPYGVALEASGNILVVDPLAGMNFRGILFRVDPRSGDRTVVSDFNIAAQGPQGFDPQGVAIESSGMILVLDPLSGMNFRANLFRVDPSDGSRTVLSDFGNDAQGPRGATSTGVTVDSSGMILVIDQEAGTNGRGALFGVNPSGGGRIVISDFGDPSEGIEGFAPSGLSEFRVKCGGLNATRIGNSFDNTINGTAGADVIHGMGGKDTINGRGGNDVICGGSGNDTLSGGIGNDRLFGQAGFDTLNGNQGNDALNGGSGADTCNGGLQMDTATGGCETRISVP